MKICHIDPFGGVTTETLQAALQEAGTAEYVTCGSVNIGLSPTRRILELLEGKPVHASANAVTEDAGVEMLVSLVQSFEPMPAMRLLKAGFAPGMRVIVGERSQAVESTTVSVIETNIDDTTPEILGYAMERLMAEGALDVSFTPMQMKKHRPATLLRVIARPQDQERLAELVFAETSTAGLRVYQAERRVQPRQVVEVDLGYGKVRIKVLPSGPAPEFEDCRQLALQMGKPVRQVFTDALRAYRD
jgi:uncharacterized protein (DUF111 family)